MIRRRGRWPMAVASAAIALNPADARGEAVNPKTIAVVGAWAPAAVSAAVRSESGTGDGSVILRPEEELLLEVRTDKWILTDAFVGYSTAQGAYLPIGDLSRLLDLAISVDSEAGRAEGWFLDPERTFRLDIGARFVETPAGRKPLQRGDAIATQGDIFVRAELIGQWLPIEASVVLAKQQVMLKLRETFPFEAKIQRAQAREGLGFKRDTRIEYPREETLYEMMGTPALDVNIRGTGGLKQAMTSQYDVRASGDLAFMNADLFVGGSHQQPFESARFTMRRRDPDGELLGPLGLTLVELGDTSSLSQAMGMRSQTGRGIVIGNTPIDRESVFDNVDLRGELPLGYEVELYRNDVLLSSVNRPVDGRYEFLQVPLEFGLNVLRLVFFGPRGERREEVRRINAGEGRLGKGEFQFEASAVQQDRQLIPIGRDLDEQTLSDPGAIRAAASAQYGLSADLTMIAGLSSFSGRGDRRNQGIVGVRTSIAGSALQVDAAMQGGGSWAVQAGLAGRVLGTSYVLQHADYAADFVDEIRNGGSGLQRVTQLRLDRGIGIGSRLVATNVIAERAQSRSQGIQHTAALRASTTLFRWLFSNALNYRSSSGEGPQIDGGLEASGRFSSWGVRAGFGYSARPKLSVRDLNITVDKELAEGLQFRLGLTQRLGRDRATRAVASIARRFGFFDFAADAQYDTSRKDFVVGTRISFGLGRGLGGWGVAPPGIARGGSVLATVFRDIDGDGLKDPIEPALAGIGLRGGGAGEVLTDKSGHALLTALGDGRPTQVVFMSETLEDPYLSPVRPGIEVVPRPGRTHVAVFPVTSVSEIEGRAYFQKDDISRAVGNVQLQLVGKDGTVVATTRTEYDGFFLFDRVAPGSYLVRLDREQATKLQIRMVEEPSVKATSDGGLAEPLKLNLVATSVNAPKVQLTN